MISVSTMRPFTRCLMTIGMIPTSYLVSMTYEEQLLWLCNYLEKEVIPALNNNAEALKEVQDLYVELKKYVDDYFSNLDVQEEINNKLDEMATDGTLDRIINQEIFGELNTQIETIENNLSPLIATKKVVMFGDSYARGSMGSGLSTTSWCARVASMMGRTNDYYSLGLSGGAFHNGTLNESFPNLVELVPLSERENVDKVIIAAGANDFVVPNLTTNIETNIHSIVNAAKTAFPNAKIYVCFIGYKNIMNETFASVRGNLLNQVIAKYSVCVDDGALFAGNIGYILHDSSLINANDGTHPNENGYELISRAIYNFVESGKSFVRPLSKSFAITEGDDISITQTNQLVLCDETTEWSSREFTVENNSGMSTNAVGVLQIGTFENPPFVRPNTSTTHIANGTALVTYLDDSTAVLSVDLRIGYNGEAYLVFDKAESNIKKIRCRSLNGSLPSVYM